VSACGSSPGAGFDWTRRYPWIVHPARRLPVARFLIDGEAVVCGEDGVSDFDRLHSRQDDGVGRGDNRRPHDIDARH